MLKTTTHIESLIQKQDWIMNPISRSLFHPFEQSIFKTGLNLIAEINPIKFILNN